MKELAKLIASLFLLLFPSPASSDTVPYRTSEISDLSFYVANKRNIYLDNYNYVSSVVSIRYGIDRDSYFFSDYMVTQGVMESWRVLSYYLDSRGISKTPCRGNEYNINIFIIDFPLFLDKKRFSYVYGSPNINVGSDFVLYAYYDSTPNIENNSMIVISQMYDPLNQENFIHEMTHYWWDRLCLSSRISGYDTESFARKIEQIYISRGSN